jgi:hypothetical protein
MRDRALLHRRHRGKKLFDVFGLAGGVRGDSAEHDVDLLLDFPRA